MSRDYSSVTEIPGGEVTPEAFRMVYTRYHLAAQHAQDTDVLEVGAGSGFGLGWMARKARRVVGTDLTRALVKEAYETYRGRIGLATVDAQHLPFSDASFDLIVCYETLYYIPDIDLFFRECRRVLRPDGKLLICTANKARPGFVKSPHSKAYYTLEDLVSLYTRNGFSAPEASGAFPATPPTLKSRLLMTGFAFADKIGLIPRTLEGRARVKRLIYGKLNRLPRELAPGELEPEPLVPMSARDQAAWKVIYTLGRAKPTRAMGGDA